MRSWSTLTRKACQVLGVKVCELFVIGLPRCLVRHAKPSLSFSSPSMFGRADTAHDLLCTKGSRSKMCPANQCSSKKLFSPNGICQTSILLYGYTFSCAMKRWCLNHSSVHRCTVSFKFLIFCTSNQNFTSTVDVCSACTIKHDNASAKTSPFCKCVALCLSRLWLLCSAEGGGEWKLAHWTAPLVHWVLTSKACEKPRTKGHAWAPVDKTPNAYFWLPTRKCVCGKVQAKIGECAHLSPQMGRCFLFVS